MFLREKQRWRGQARSRYAANFACCAMDIFDRPEILLTAGPAWGLNEGTKPILEGQSDVVRIQAEWAR